MRVYWKNTTGAPAMRTPGRYTVDMSQLNDPGMDKMLTLTRTETGPTKRQEAVNAAQKKIVEDAVVVFLYVPKTFSLLNTRIKGAVFSQTTNTTYLHDACIEVQ